MKRLSGREHVWARSRARVEPCAKRGKERTNTLLRLVNLLHGCAIRDIVRQILLLNHVLKAALHRVPPNELVVEAQV